MSNDETNALEGVSITFEQSKSSVKSRNHYGHKYTLLKMENHQLKCEIGKMKERVMNAVNHREDMRDRCSRITLIVFSVGALVGGMVALAIEKGVVK
jgi:hypothetical protein